MARKPEFIIIGAAKSGTTSLYHYLIRHPSIFMCTPKEPSYFAFDDRFNRGVDWYLSLFSSANENQLCGEASTNYTNWPLYPHTAERMHALLPDVKLIYIMRHPVNRAYSHYLQLIQNIRIENPSFGFTDTFEQHIEKDDSIIQSSNYILQINHFLKYYPRDQFLFLFFEEFIENAEATLSIVADFLHIDNETDLIADNIVKENIYKDREDWLIRSRLMAPFKAIPGAKWLAEFLPQGFRDVIYGMLRKSPTRKKIEAEFIPPKMLPETRSHLLRYFRTPNQELAEFLGKELSHWDS